MALHPQIEAEVLNALFRNVTLPSKGNIEAALYTGNPQTSGVEVDSLANPSYARQRVTFNAPIPGNPSICTNNIVVEFVCAPNENWGEVTHVALMTLSGEIIMSGALPQSRIMNSSEGEYTGSTISLKFNVDYLVAALGDCIGVLPAPDPGEDGAGGVVFVDDDAGDPDDDAGDPGDPGDDDAGEPVLPD
jgi:hypothetical protein